MSRMKIVGLIVLAVIALVMIAAQVSPTLDQFLTAKIMTALNLDYATVGTVPYVNGSKNLVSSGATIDQYGTITLPFGAHNESGYVYLDNQSASRAVILNASKQIVADANVSSTELGYLDGVTSAIQTQLNALAPATAPTFATSITGSFLTASTMLCVNASKQIVSCSPTIRTGANTACTSTCSGHLPVLAAWNTDTAFAIVAADDAAADGCYCAN